MTKINLILFFIIVFSTGCVFTKVVSVPLRVTGAVISVVPWAGDKMHDAIDSAADTIDDIPI